MFRGRVTFTNEEPAPTTQHFQHQQHGGSLAAHRPSSPPAVRAGLEFGQRHYQAGDERYVETVSYSKTSTNDASINLQKAADRQANGGSNSTTLNLCLGLAFAAVAGKAFMPVLERSLEVFGVIVLGFFLFGFFILNGQLSKKGGGGAR